MIYQEIVTGLESLSDKPRAKAMEAYMKNKFIFYGVPSPVRIALVRECHKKYSVKTLDRNLVSALWKCSQRECQYAAMDHLKRFKRFLTNDDFPWIVSLITEKSWWDSVDFLAVHAMGEIASKSETIRNTDIETFLLSENIWLIRTAIIYQLKYKQLTDFDKLCRYILMFLGSKEFFINKASGWALREYAKTDPLAVKQFVEATPELSNLTKREALKHFG